ncbi:MAG: HMA2 domain-containing protein [Desulfomonilaceae bacterium]
MGFYIHETPGRLRLKIPGLKRNVELADELTLLLREKRGIDSIDVNALTGSVKVNFDESQVTSTTLLNLLSQEGHIDLTKLVSSSRYMDTVFSEAGRVASKAILSLVLDKALEGSSLSIIAALI